MMTRRMTEDRGFWVSWRSHGYVAKQRETEGISMRHDTARYGTHQVTTSTRTTAIAEMLGRS